MMQRQSLQARVVPLGLCGVSAEISRREGEGKALCGGVAHGHAPRFMAAMAACSSSFVERPPHNMREFSPGDDFYEALIQAHEGLSDAQSHEMNAKLVLFLANHIGDLRVLREAFAAARASVVMSTPSA
jgi:hypothetical protein